MVTKTLKTDGIFLYEHAVGLSLFTLNDRYELPDTSPKKTCEFMCDIGI